jgi:hypothetical protein
MLYVIKDDSGEIKMIVSAEPRSETAIDEAIESVTTWDELATKPSFDWESLANKINEKGMTVMGYREVSLGAKVET